MNDYSLRFRLTKGYHNSRDSTASHSPSPYWPKDLFEKLPSHRHSAIHTHYTDYNEGKTTNDWRFGSIVIDWLDSEVLSTSVSSESDLIMEQENTQAFVSKLQRRLQYLTQCRPF